MKKMAIALTIVMTTALIYACKKQDAYVRHSPDEMASKLYLTKSFIQFSEKFIQDFHQFASYLREPAQQKNRAVFLTSFREAEKNESPLENLLQQHNLSMDEWMTRKNKLDNDFLQLFLQLPELRTYSDDEILQIIREGIQLGMRSQDDRWKEIRQQKLTKSSLLTVGILHTGAEQNMPMVIDGKEVWDCLKDAVGLGAASVLGIGALKKLASQGVHSIVVSLTKFLAKNAGWIGLGIMVIDFSTCLYHENQD
jgi:hypothetical protein